MYKYKGFYFEISYMYGPLKLRKDGSEAKKMGRLFWKVYAEWEKLTEEEQVKTQISE
jgi:hypothetical protein